MAGNQKRTEVLLLASSLTIAADDILIPILEDIQQHLSSCKQNAKKTVLSKLHCSLSFLHKRCSFLQAVVAKNRNLTDKQLDNICTRWQHVYDNLTNTNYRESVQEILTWEDAKFKDLVKLTVEIENWQQKGYDNFDIPALIILLGSAGLSVALSNPICLIVGLIAGFGLFTYCCFTKKKASVDDLLTELDQLSKATGSVEDFAAPIEGMLLVVRKLQEFQRTRECKNCLSYVPESEPLFQPCCSSSSCQYCQQYICCAHCKDKVRRCVCNTSGVLTWKSVKAQDPKKSQ